MTARRGSWPFNQSCYLAVVEYDVSGDGIDGASLAAERMASTTCFHYQMSSWSCFFELQYPDGASAPWPQTRFHAPTATVYVVIVQVKKERAYGAALGNHHHKLTFVHRPTSLLGRRPAVSPCACSGLRRHDDRISAKTPPCLHFLLLVVHARICTLFYRFCSRPR